MKAMPPTNVGRPGANRKKKRKSLSYRLAKHGDEGISQALANSMTVLFKSIKIASYRATQSGVKNSLSACTIVYFFGLV
jgi:hypothetical protein